MDSFVSPFFFDLNGDVEHSKNDYVALGRGPWAQGPGEFLLNPSRQGERLEEDWTDPAGQHLVAQVMLPIGIQLL